MSSELEGQRKAKLLFHLKQVRREVEEKEQKAEKGKEGEMEPGGGGRNFRQKKRHNQLINLSVGIAQNVLYSIKLSQLETSLITDSIKQLGLF